MISTSIEKLDRFLGGGIKNGIILDIFGARGTGKTHLAIQISLNSLKNGGEVFFLDTSGGFRPERMLEIIKSKNLDPVLLDKVRVGRATNTYDQINFISKISESNFSLIIIDNVTELFSFEYPKENQLLEKNSLFMNYMHSLSALAIKKHIPIIVTNSIRKIDDTEKENLEKAISIFTHLKIKLSKQGTKFFGELLPSNESKKEFSYIITGEGLSEIPQSI